MIVATLPMRDGTLSMAAVIDLYMAQYSGRDVTRTARLDWWRHQIGHLRLEEVMDDHIHVALESLKAQPGRYFAGRDYQGQPIYKSRRKPLTGATINRYCAAVSAVFTWTIKRRIAPKGYAHPVRGIDHERESPGKTRFLSDDERVRLLAACKVSKWPRLYLLVLLGLTTGARRGELLGLRWRDVDLVQRVLHVGRSKNGDPKLLPLVAAAAEELQRFAGDPDALVFPARLRPDQPMAVEDRWRQALKAAGIRHCRIHDLRHSCASMLAANGATLLEIGDLLGHRHIAMTKRYSHLTSRHRSALVERVMGDVR
jgi:integrase